MRLIILISALLSCTSYARTPYRLPPGTRLQVPEGTLQGFTLEEMKVVLKMDVDLEFYEKTVLPIQQKSLKDFEGLVKAKEKILLSKDVQIRLLETDQIRLTEKWSQENKLRHECENSPKFGSWLAWGVAGVATVAALTLGVVVIVQNK